MSPKKNDGNTRAAYMKRLLRLTKMRDWHPSVGSERRVPQDGLLGIARHCYVFHHSEHHSLQCPSGLASFDPLGKLSNFLVLWMCTETAASVERNACEVISYQMTQIFVKRFRKQLGPTDLKNNWNRYLSNNGNSRREETFLDQLTN